MAAVVCNLIGEVCDNLGKLCCRPACQALNLGCSSCVEVFKSPFFAYLALTFGLNFPSVVYGVKSINSGCGSLQDWMIGSAVLSAIHMLGAWYIVNKIREPVGSDPAQDEGTNVEEGGTPYWAIPKENETGSENSVQRIKHVLCYDKIMAAYIIVFVFWLVWLSIGVHRLFAFEGACNEVEHYVKVALGCGYTFFSLVGITFVCSLCCLR